MTHENDMKIKSCPYTKFYWKTFIKIHMLSMSRLFGQALCKPTKSKIFFILSFMIMINNGSGSFCHYLISVTYGITLSSWVFVVPDSGSLAIHRRSFPSAFFRMGSKWPTSLPKDSGPTFSVPTSMTQSQIPCSFKAVQSRWCGRNCCLGFASSTLLSKRGGTTEP